MTCRQRLQLTHYCDSVTDQERAIFAKKGCPTCAQKPEVKPEPQPEPKQGTNVPAHRCYSAEQAKDAQKGDAVYLAVMYGAKRGCPNCQKIKQDKGWGAPQPKVEPHDCHTQEEAANAVEDDDIYMDVMYGASIGYPKRQKVKEAKGW